MSKFTIGIDFGTLSARAVLVDVHSGAVAACAVENASAFFRACGRVVVEGWFIHGSAA